MDACRDPGLMVQDCISQLLSHPPEVRPLDHTMMAYHEGTLMQKGLMLLCACGKCFPAASLMLMYMYTLLHSVCRMCMCKCMHACVLSHS